MISYLYVDLSFEYSMVDDFDLVTAILLLGTTALLLLALFSIGCAIVLAALAWVLFWVLFLLLKFSNRGP